MEIFTFNQLIEENTDYFSH